MLLLKLLVFCGVIALSFGSVAVQDLGGTEWSASGDKPPSSLVVHLPHATVPGCIHLDWMKGKNVTEVELE